MEYGFSQGVRGGLSNLSRSLLGASGIRQQAAQSEMDAMMGADLKFAQAQDARAKSELSRELLRRRQNMDADLETSGAAAAGMTLPEYRAFLAFQRSGSMPQTQTLTSDPTEPVAQAPQFDPARLAAGRRALAAMTLGGQMKDIDPLNVARAGGEYQQQQTSDMALDAVRRGDMTAGSALNQVAKPGQAVKLFENVGNTGAAMAPATGAVTSTGPMAEAEIGRRQADVKLKENQGEAALALARKRDAPPVVVVGGGRGGAAQKAPVGYRFSSDGETLEPIPGGPKDPNARPDAKPLPTQALKIQREELDAIATAGGIAADLAAVRDLIDQGKLDLGPVSNIVAQGRNMAGVSNEASRNFATFRATLEKLRNDSLRLNKGVQTEGDAVRAWNELVQSINDPQVVRQRIEEIIKINDRAATLRRLNLDAIRANYGAPPLDVTPYAQQPAAIGGGGQLAPAPAPRAGGGASSSWDGVERRQPTAPRVMRFDAQGNPIP